MTALEIERAGPLSGTVPIQGSKNTVLPILAASLLCPGVTTLENVPKIQDVDTMLLLMEKIGCRIIRNGCSVRVDASVLNDSGLPKEAAARMRSSVNLLAPVLVRCGHASIGKPGGCSLGSRPVDLHLYALEQLGADVSVLKDRIEADAKTLHGAEISFRISSVGATQQALTAAAAANGETVIYHAAKEPEVAALCRFLQQMGVPVEGIGTDTLRVTGIREFRPASVSIGADRIVAATCMSAVAACGGSAKLLGVTKSAMAGIVPPFVQMGCRAVFDADGMTISRTGELKPISYIETEPYPGFPTDVQSLLLAVLTQADGQSVVKEKVFEARFRAAYQLQKMGADIIIESNCAIVRQSRLRGCGVCAPDLRGGAALAVAGLCADGRTQITGYGHICRGYEDIAGMLRLLGAKTGLLQTEE